MASGSKNASGSAPKSPVKKSPVKRSLPARRSLVQEVAEWLRQKIRSGAFDGPLPSHRALRTQLQVGRSTVQAAFALLRKEGVIELQPRKRALPSHPKLAVGQNKIGWLDWDVDRNISSRRRQDILFFQTMIQQRGFDFELYISNTCTTRSRTRNRVPLLNHPNVHCWLLFNQPREIQERAARKGLNAVVVGSRAEGVSLPWIDLNWRGAARHATGSALARGHRRLAFFCSKADTPDHEEVVSGVRDAFQAHEGEAGASLEVIRHDETRHGILRVLRQLWLWPEGPPTVVIVKEAYAALTIYSTLLSRYGVSIPGEVSLVSLEEDVAFNRVNPAISAYGIGTQVLWRQLVFAVTRIARLDGSWHYAVQPHPVDGETFASVPTGTKTSRERASQ